jgi:CxxC-x17-CxxC domain-containing protein
MRDFNKRNSFRDRDNDSRGRDSGRRFDRNDRRGEKPEMHKVVCDKCGKNCEVPFKPSSDKPIFCDDCFREKNRSNSNRPESRSFGRQNSREREYFKATCDECGKACEVPFKPTSGKPILCSMCFDKQGSRPKENTFNANNNVQFDKQFKALNDKLDEILKHLSLTPIKNKVTKEKIVAKTKIVKKVIKEKKSKKTTKK